MELRQGVNCLLSAMYIATIGASFPEPVAQPFFDIRDHKTISYAPMDRSDEVVNKLASESASTIDRILETVPLSPDSVVSNRHGAFLRVPAILAQSPSASPVGSPTESANQRVSTQTQHTQSSSMPEHPFLTALVFFASLIPALLLVWILVKYADRVGGEGWTHYILVYTILVLIALVSSGVMFSLLQTTAHVSGTYYGIPVDLGSSAALFAIVLVVGDRGLRRLSKEDFSVTAFVHGIDGRDNQILRTGGKVVVLAGDRRIEESINQDGVAKIGGIPAKFRGQVLPVSIEVPGFELADGNVNRKLVSPLQITARRKAGAISGQVCKENGAPAPNASVMVGGVRGDTDQNGYFCLKIPGEAMKPILLMTVQTDGYRTYRTDVTPDSNPVQITLTRACDGSGA